MCLRKKVVSNSNPFEEDFIEDIDAAAAAAADGETADIDQTNKQT
jgi:hypothetical protein